MRTIEEFRQRQIEGLANALMRPMYYCGSGEGAGRYAELYFRTILDGLCWLDERTVELRRLEGIEGALLWGPLGAYGKLLDQQLAIPDDCLTEITSTYAQAAYRLGYFMPKRLLNESEMKNLPATTSRKFFATDHTLSKIVSKFGAPSHEVFGTQTTVHCYGCVDRAVDWVYFDYARCYPPKDLRTYEWFDEEMLRDVRGKGNRLKLLPFGDWCRPRARRSTGGRRRRGKTKN